MLQLKRQDELLQILRAQRYATVEELAARLYASPATVRRDLALLQQAGLVERSHGGAALKDERSQTLPLSLRSQTHAREKEQIGRMAAERVRDGDVVMLDASSTALCAARHLGKRQNLTLVTNSMRVVEEAARQGHRVYMTGGLLQPNSDAFAGEAAEDCLRRFNADVLFFSSAGVRSDGMICDYSEEETRLRRVMLACARRRIFLCDSSKLARVFPHNLIPVSQVDEALCDKPLPPEWRMRND